MNSAMGMELRGHSTLPRANDTRSRVIDRSNLSTEQRLADSMRLDGMSASEIVQLMQQQDAAAVHAVEAAGDAIVAVTEAVIRSFQRGGRLFYFGAGTSGRLGVLDAAECPPTFRTDPEMVQGVIAGGERAMFVAQEGAEDDFDDGAVQVDARAIEARDVVIGIAAGGTTPFVRGALTRAKQRGAFTAFLTCVQAIDDEPAVDQVIRIITGPEVLTGSTRLKAGTVTKLVLNRITTAAMVRMGKCFENLMVDLRATNEKLRDRGVRIISTITGVDRTTALNRLDEAAGHVKLAILMQMKSINSTQAAELLSRSNGRLRDAIKA
jgi:N-acetylmuramic acid 6-phosphate etherase